MIKAVIFDMDGVLIDSQPSHFKAEKETITHFGYPMTEMELKQYLGWRGDEFWADVIQKYSLPATVDELTDFNRPIIHKHLKEAAKPDKLLQGILSDLKKKMKLSVASSAQKSSIEIILQGLEIEQYFDVVVCGAEVKRGKPEPDLFLLAAEKMNVMPEECAVIEDAPSGIQAANSARMFSVALKGQINSDLDLSEADVVIESLNELPELLAKTAH